LATRNGIRGAWGGQRGSIKTGWRRGGEKRVNPLAGYRASVRIKETANEKKKKNQQEKRGEPGKKDNDTKRGFMDKQKNGKSWDSQGEKGGKKSQRNSQGKVGSGRR